MALINISKLQRENDTAIFSVVDRLSKDSPEARGQLLGTDSPIEDILMEWAEVTVKELRESWIKKGFNEASNAGDFEPYIVDKAGVLACLVLDSVNDTASFFSEHGRKRGKMPPVEPIAKWITYRGIDVNQVRGWKTKYKDSKGRVRTIKPYKSLSNTLQLREVMAWSIARTIARKGSIKRFGQKGSRYISEVINDQSLSALSAQLSDAVGYKISVSLAKAI